MPPAEQASAGPKGRPLAFASRDEVGAAFAAACRVAIGERRTSRRGGIHGWWRHPAVELVLDEIRLRLWEEQEMVDRQLSLLDSLQSPEQD